MSLPPLFTETMTELCARAAVAPGSPLRWLIIANPTAGGFTIPSRWRRHAQALSTTLARVASRPRRVDAAPVGGLAEGPMWGAPPPTPPAGRARPPGLTHWTFFGRGLKPPSQKSPVVGLGGPPPSQRGWRGRRPRVRPSDPLPAGVVATAGPGEAGRVVRGALGSEGFLLVVTAGGDGTSREVLEEVMGAGARCAVVRLPMGTGNDGADAWEMGDALRLLVEPVEVAWRRAVRLTTASGRVSLTAFNVLSLGLDAFVTGMTNRMKHVLPGDSYKLWVDIAALFYDRIYRVETMSVRGFDEAGRETAAFDGRTLLLAMGESGHRTYGSRKRILPDERNVCLLRQMPLLRKLDLKERFNTGTHVDTPEALVFSASRVEVAYAHPIHAQADGEATPLTPDDFPVTLELTPPVIPTLRLA